MKSNFWLLGVSALSFAVLGVDGIPALAQGISLDEAAIVEDAKEDAKSEGAKPVAISDELHRVAHAKSKISDLERRRDNLIMLYLELEDRIYQAEATGKLPPNLELARSIANKTFEQIRALDKNIDLFRYGVQQFEARHAVTGGDLQALREAEKTVASARKPVGYTCTLDHSEGGMVSSVPFAVSADASAKEVCVSEKGYSTGKDSTGFPVLPEGSQMEACVFPIYFGKSGSMVSRLMSNSDERQLYQQAVVKKFTESEGEIDMAGLFSSIEFANRHPILTTESFSRKAKQGNAELTCSASYSQEEFEAFKTVETIFRGLHSPHSLFSQQAVDPTKTAAQAQNLAKADTKAIEAPAAAPATATTGEKKAETVTQ